MNHTPDCAQKKNSCKELLLGQKMVVVTMYV